MEKKVTIEGQDEMIKEAIRKIVSKRQAILDKEEEIKILKQDAIATEQAWEDNEKIQTLINEVGKMRTRLHKVKEISTQEMKRNKPLSIRIGDTSSKAEMPKEVDSSITEWIKSIRTEVAEQKPKPVKSSILTHEDIIKIIKPVKFEEHKIDKEEEKELSNRTMIAQAITYNKEHISKEDKELTKKITESEYEKEDLSSPEFALHVLSSGLKQEGVDSIITKEVRLGGLTLFNSQLLSSTEDTTKYECKIPMSYEEVKKVISDPESERKLKEKIREDLSKELKIPLSAIVITEIRAGSLMFDLLIYWYDSLEFQNELQKGTTNDTKKKVEKVVEKVFNNKDITVENKGPSLDTFTFAIQSLDPVHNADYSTLTSGIYYRGGLPYYFPEGKWKRLGINVKNKYTGGNDWIDYENEKGWAVAFHGLRGIPEKNIAPDGTLEEVVCRRARQLFTSDNSNGTKAYYGAGVYCAPNLKTVEEDLYMLPTKVQLKDNKIVYYKIAFQCRVDNKQEFYPDNIQKTKGVSVIYRKGKKGRNHKEYDAEARDYWVVRDSTKIRPYGIMICQCDPPKP